LPAPWGCETDSDIEDAAALATPGSFSCRTDDPDEARSICRRFYYPLELDPIGSVEGFSFSCDIFELGPIVLGELAFASDVQLRTTDLETAYHVNSPLTGEVQSRHRDVAVTASPTAVAVYQPEGGALLRPWAAGCRQLSVRIHRGALENQLERMLGHPMSAPIRFQHCLDVSGGSGRTWVRMLRLLRQELRDRSALVHHPLMAEQLSRSVLSGLLLTSEHQYSGELARSDPPSRPRTVKRTIDAMEADPGRPFTIADLAAIAGVGPRALQDGFQRYVGLSPMAYLRRLRLARVHEELREPASPDQTVASVAHRWGFMHLGRFASDYRSCYGQSPSETLRLHR
jgi:AraC-like DNA-binding protein